MGFKVPEKEKEALIINRHFFRNMSAITSKTTANSINPRNKYLIKISEAISLCDICILVIA